MSRNYPDWEIKADVERVMSKYLAWYADAKTVQSTIFELKDDMTDEDISKYVEYVQNDTFAALVFEYLCPVSSDVEADIKQVFLSQEIIGKAIEEQKDVRCKVYYAMYLVCKEFINVNYKVYPQTFVIGKTKKEYLPKRFILITFIDQNFDEEF